MTLARITMFREGKKKNYQVINLIAKFIAWVKRKYRISHHNPKEGIINCNFDSAYPRNLCYRLYNKTI